MTIQPKQINTGLYAFPERLDCSVNSAYVESPNSATPTLHARTGGNTTTGFVGAGTGNKPILGMDVTRGFPLAVPPFSMPLSGLVSLEWTWLDQMPWQAGQPCYANVLVDLTPGGGVRNYRVLIINPVTPLALANYSNVVNPDGSTTTSFATASNNWFVAGGVPLMTAGSVVAGPPASGPLPSTVPVTATVGAGPLANAWSTAAILALYPGAVILRGQTGDGGLPRGMNIPAFLVATGDSVNNVIRSFRVSNIRWNGVAA